MGTINMEIIFPAPAAIFGVFLGIFVIWLAYKVAKFVISVWTGA